METVYEAAKRMWLGQFVWGYSEEEGLFGIPLPITTKGARIQLMMSR
jgi:hypothetical protein